MRRWHEDYSIAFRQWKIHRRSHVESNKMRRVGYEKYEAAPGSDPFKVDCACDEQVGRFRKKDAHDCGNTQCGICHQDKFPKRDLTRQELFSALSFKEQVREFYEEEEAIPPTPITEVRAAA